MEQLISSDTNPPFFQLLAIALSGFFCFFTSSFCTAIILSLNARILD
jgi:hypothetical protein